MINNQNQQQKSGDNSQNNQAQGNINITNNYYGITKETAKAELLQIFIDNFPVLRQIAAYEVKRRAEELLDEFIERISKQEEKISQKIFTRLSEPDMQCAILEAQKGYAKSGNKEKLKILTELLINKGKENEHTLKNYLIDEAIEKISKLTKEQLDILSLMVSETLIYGPRNKEEFSELFLKKLVFYIDAINLETIETNIQYLIQCNCIRQFSITSGGNDLIKHIKKQYQGIFAKGFMKEDFEKIVPIQGKESILIPCLNDPTLYQINRLNLKEVENLFDKENFTQTEKQTIIEYFNITFSDQEIIDIITKKEPKLKELLNEEFIVNSYKLMPLGIYLGIKNIEITTNENINWNF